MRDFENLLADLTALAEVNEGQKKGVARQLAAALKQRYEDIQYSARTWADACDLVSDRLREVTEGVEPRT